MKLPRLQINPVVRISLGLASLLMAGLLVADTLLGLVPRPDAMLQEHRVRTAESLAIQLAVLMGAKDPVLLMRTLEQVTGRDSNILSAAIRRDGGKIVAQAGAHDRYWLPPPPGESTLEQIRVPLIAGERKWGDLELSFQPPAARGAWGWLQQHALALPLLIGAGGFVLFSLYLRKVLQYLDPSAVIPERVRAAFDGFSEGVMVVDKSGRIMLANTAFRGWAERGDGSLFGHMPQELPWFRETLRRDPRDYPWMQAMSTSTMIKGEQVDFPNAAGQRIKAVINCAPIHDSEGTARGCMVTFNDVTEIERVNLQLLGTLDQLKQSQEELEHKNEELQRLATRDPLTGCLNRRAFYEALDKLYAQARDGGPGLCCIMSDIDHFKLFNDRYGHAVGDQVLQAVARTLSGGMRAIDLLCRYGGEEFCIVLPGAPLEVANAVAERLRSDIEVRAASSVRSTQSLKITSSFGVAILTPEMTGPAQLIEHADQALYAAKDSGRNRVQTWQQLEAERATQE